MTKKKVSLIQATLQLIAIVTLFIPISFGRFVDGYSYYSGFSSYYYKEPFVVAMEHNTVAFILFMLVSIANLVYFVLYFKTNNPQLRQKYWIALPCISCPLLVWNAFSVVNGGSSISRTGIFETASYTMESYFIRGGFYIVCVLYLAIMVLELYKRFAKIDE